MPVVIVDPHELTYCDVCKRRAARSKVFVYTKGDAVKQIGSTCDKSHPMCRAVRELSSFMKKTLSNHLPAFRVIYGLAVLHQENPDAPLSIKALTREHYASPITPEIRHILQDFFDVVESDKFRAALEEAQWWSHARWLKRFLESTHPWDQKIGEIQTVDFVQLCEQVFRHHAFYDGYDRAARWLYTQHMKHVTMDQMALKNYKRWWS